MIYRFDILGQTVLRIAVVESLKIAKLASNVSLYSALRVQESRENFLSFSI